VFPLSNRVTCVVNYDGPSDFTRSYGKSVDAAEVPLFLGGDLQKAQRRHVVASPLYWVTPHAAPTPRWPRRPCSHSSTDT
jgi:hypothetical protein